MSVSRRDFLSLVRSHRDEESIAQAHCRTRARSAVSAEQAAGRRAAGQQARAGQGRQGGGGRGGGRGGGAGGAGGPQLPEGVEVIRISSNENPLGPGKTVLDAIVNKFPEAGRYPFNSTPSEGKLAETIAALHKAKPENVVLGGGSQEILKSAIRAFTSPFRPLVTARADVRELHGPRRAGWATRSTK